MREKYKPRHKRANRWRIAVQVMIVILLAVLLLYPYAETFWTQVERTYLTDSDLPQEIRRLRIAYVTDIHMSGFPFYSQSRTSKLIQEINRQNPDIILLGGDFTNDPESTLTFFHLIRDQKITRFRASYGVYAVLGERDIIQNEASGQERAAALVELQRAMNDAGVTLLVNSVADIRIGATAIHVAGLDVPKKESHDLKELASNVYSEDYVIFLCHSPSVISETSRVTSADGKHNWFDLGLFGHTHGGQMMLLDGLLNVSGDNVRYQSGWFVENRVPMLISNGIGTVTVPFRLFRRPQIHIITVTNN